MVLMPFIILSVVLHNEILKVTNRKTVYVTHDLTNLSFKSCTSAQLSCSIT